MKRKWDEPETGNEAFEINIDDDEDEHIEINTFSNSKGKSGVAKHRTISLNDWKSKQRQSPNKNETNTIFETKLTEES